MFIVRNNSNDLTSSVTLIRNMREDALETANDLLCQSFALVTIESEGRVYTVEEFASRTDGSS